MRDISDGVSKGASGVERITEWWHTVRDELVRLEVQFTNGQLAWGSSPETTYSMKAWESLGEEFAEYSKRMGGNLNGEKSKSCPPDYEAATN